MVTRRARGTSRVATGFTVSTFAIFSISRLPIPPFAPGRRRQIEIFSAAVWDYPAGRGRVDDAVLVWMPLGSFLTLTPVQG
jgi:hypothetical protein